MMMYHPGHSTCSGCVSSPDCGFCFPPEGANSTCLPADGAGYNQVCVVVKVEALASTLHSENSQVCVDVKLLFHFIDQSSC